MNSTMATQTESRFSDQMLSFLDRLQTEFEEFRVQASLGKMDAADRFESLKAEYSNVLSHAIEVVNKSGPMLGARVARIRPALEHLKLQLALGRAELVENYEVQKRRILEAMESAVELIEWEELENPITGRPLRHDFERLRINLELLRLNYALKRLDVEQDWKNQVVAVVDHWKEKINSRKREWDSRADKVMNEVKHAYDHLLKAIGQI